MPFPLNLLNSRQSSQSHRSDSPNIDGYDTSSSSDSTETAKSLRPQRDHNRPQRPSYVVSSSTSLHTPPGNFVSTPDFILHPSLDHPRPSSSQNSSVPSPSRPHPPLPQFYSTPSSTYTSDADSEPTSPLLSRTRRRRWWVDDSSRWWSSQSDRRRRRRRRDSCFSVRSFKRLIRAIIRHPLFPTQPTSILLTLFLLTIFAILLTLLLIHILNPDKEPLPWRVYCSIPSMSTSPPFASSHALSPAYPFNSLTPAEISSISSLLPPPFPPTYLDDLPPAGILLGVFSMDSAADRRMYIRNSWASHIRSRNGAGSGDDGLGTSRTVVRFVLGKPRKHWERRIQLEAEMYNDMIVLPISENMNSGKTHAFFNWASTSAWVPPLPSNHSFRSPVSSFSYSNVTAPSTIPLAKHDPISAQQELQQTGKQSPWVRPDFVIKVDDDSFVMLAELESRLRVELNRRVRRQDTDLYTRDPGTETLTEVKSNTAESTATTSTLSEGSHPRAPSQKQPTVVRPPIFNDPLIYWGYLVKNQFMAGELYALSWSLVEWAANDPTVKGMTRGKEDKQVAKWMRIHPYAQEVRWVSERCWIYDHPRAGTVYSHGFLFPSEVTRVKNSILSYVSSFSDADPSSPPSVVTPPSEGTTPTSWAYSSVSTFGVRYNPPIPDLNTLQSIEALVEGSEMSKLKEGGDITAADAWSEREGRRKRYEEKRVGGTVVVHFIKKNPWYMETALAFLEGIEFTEKEHHRRSVEAELAMAAMFNVSSSSPSIVDPPREDALLVHHALP